jgi:hypothetical protein
MTPMADEPFSTQRLLSLRKLTRAVADLMRGQLRDYLATLAPLFRPRAVLGEHIQAEVRERLVGSEVAFKDLQNLYQALGPVKPFSLPVDELRPPIEVTSSAVEMTAWEYTHTAKTDRQTKTVTVTSPLKWVLSYTGFGPKRFAELLAERNRNQSQVRDFLLHFLMMHVVMARQPGLVKILEALHFSVSTGRVPGLGEMPVTFVSAATTVRPPDDVVIESTELSGRDVFEELVLEDAPAEWHDPLRDRVAALIQSRGPDSPVG